MKKYICFGQNDGGFTHILGFFDTLESAKGEAEKSEFQHYTIEDVLTDKIVWSNDKDLVDFV